MGRHKMLEGNRAGSFWDRKRAVMPWLSWFSFGLDDTVVLAGQVWFGQAQELFVYGKGRVVGVLVYF